MDEQKESRQLTAEEVEAMTRRYGDMKAQAMRPGGITASRPKLSMIPRIAQVHITRALEYGADKYRRSNFYGPCPPGVTPAERLLGYLDAAQRHITRVTDALNLAIGTGGDVRAAASTIDDFPSGGFPASCLPDLAHALASLAIGVMCAAMDGLLPEDPGQPWKAKMEPQQGLPQKDDPAAERARVDALRQGTEWGVPIGGAQ